MKVSVIIPAWNAADTLPATLDSLLAQTIDAWEAIVVDDGSTDDTPCIAAKYAKADRRIRFVSQSRAGEAGARNAGIQTSRHECILFLDADDWIAPTHLEKLTGALARDPGLGAAFCRYARVASDGTEVPDPYFPPPGKMFDVWARRSAFPIHACVVRRSLVEQVGGFDPGLAKSTDWDFWQRVARSGTRFGAVDAVLAFYRMSPGAASLDPSGMLRDGLEVLRRGHAPDPRVRRPDPEFEAGADPVGMQAQAWYLFCWCAALEIGAGGRPERLFDAFDFPPFPQIHAPAVARCIFDAAPLPSRLPPKEWMNLWPRLARSIDDFLGALAARCDANGLSTRARSALARLVLEASDRGELARIAGEEIDRLEAEVSDQARWIRHHEATIATLEARVRDLEDRAGPPTARGEAPPGDAAPSGSPAIAVAGGQETPSGNDPAIERLRAEKMALAKAQRRLEGELNALRDSPERWLGDVLLNRLKLGKPMRAAAAVGASVRHRSVLAGLRRDRIAAADSLRVVTTVCWNFPIHSHTFVYQELDAMLERGFAVRLIYSRDEGRDGLHDRFARLWPLRRRLVLHRPLNARDFEHYRARFPARVDELVEMLSRASGLSPGEVVEHGNFLEAFSFTRLVESYRPHYLHSYFFYDRSLMALVASFLLRIPRGISCYTDHLLDDYELKVVPLHLELADVIVATSHRIARELREINPRVAAERIIVKPNGIATRWFPEFERGEAPHPLRVVSVSRIEPKKGLIELVEAIALLRGRGVPVEAHIVGSADEQSWESVDYRRRLDERIDELGLRGSVHLEGRQDLSGILRFLGSSQIFVAPYTETVSGDKDGIPTALLEAMSTGLPAVATDAGSIPEAVEHGVHGLIVPQRDAVALADAVEALARDPARRAAMGRAAAIHVRDRFDSSDCERLLHDRIVRLVEGRGAR